MMSKTTDYGGPAFPLPPVSHHGQVVALHGTDATGMTLRDYFATRALLCAGPANKPPAYDDDTRAKYAYELADAMLRARGEA